MMKNNNIAVILSLFFWTVLFLTNDYSNISENNKETTFSINKEDNNYFARPENVEKSIQDFKESQKIFSKKNMKATALYLYGFIVLFLLILPEKKMKVLSLFLYSFMTALIITIIASIYYYVSKGNFYTNVYDDHKSYFVLLNIIPFMLISYQIFRILFKRILGREPELSPKFGWIENPANWIFTLVSGICGVLIGLKVDLIGLIDGVISNFA